MSWSPQQEAAEVWRDIRYSEYEASSLGRIRNKKTGKIQKPSVGRDGYLLVGLRFLDQKHSKKVHQLVCLAFNGVKPAGAQCVRHLDGDKMNNRPENLRWGTNKENAADTILHGKQVSGFDHPNVHIKKDEALHIRSEYMREVAGKRKAPNGLIIRLSNMYAHLGYKCVYKAATGAYDRMMPGEIESIRQSIAAERITIVN